VVRTPNAFQDPAGLFQLADELSAPHSVYYTHPDLRSQGDRPVFATSAMKFAVSFSTLLNT
jgi:hypothetical protein